MAEEHEQYVSLDPAEWDIRTNTVWEDEILPALGRVAPAKNPQFTLIGCVPGVQGGMAKHEFGPGVNEAVLEAQGASLVELSVATSAGECGHLVDVVRINPWAIRNLLLSEAQLPGRPTEADLRTIADRAQKLAVMATQHAVQHGLSAVVAVDLSRPDDLEKIVSGCQQKGITPELRIAIPRSTEVAYGDHVAYQKALGNQVLERDLEEISLIAALDESSSLEDGTTTANSVPAPVPPQFRTTLYDHHATRLAVMKVIARAIEAGAKIALVDGDNQPLYIPAATDPVVDDPNRFAQLLQDLQQRGTTLPGHMMVVQQWEDLIGKFGPETSKEAVNQANIQWGGARAAHLDFSEVSGGLLAKIRLEHNNAVPPTQPPLVVMVVDHAGHNPKETSVMLGVAARPLPQREPMALVNGVWVADLLSPPTNAGVYQSAPPKTKLEAHCYVDTFLAAKLQAGSHVVLSDPWPTSFQRLVQRVPTEQIRLVLVVPSEEELLIAACSNYLADLQAAQVATEKKQGDEQQNSQPNDSNDGQANSQVKPIPKFDPERYVDHIRQREQESLAWAVQSGIQGIFIISSNGERIHATEQKVDPAVEFETWASSLEQPEGEKLGVLFSRSPRLSEAEMSATQTARAEKLEICQNRLPDDPEMQKVIRLGRQLKAVMEGAMRDLPVPETLRSQVAELIRTCQERSLETPEGRLNLSQLPLEPVQPGNGPLGQTSKPLLVVMMGDPTAALTDGLLNAYNAYNAYPSPNVVVPSVGERTAEQAEGVEQLVVVQAALPNQSPGDLAQIVGRFPGQPWQLDLVIPCSETRNSILYPELAKGLRRLNDNLTELARKLGLDQVDLEPDSNVTDVLSSTLRQIKGWVGEQNTWAQDAAPDSALDAKMPAASDLLPSQNEKSFEALLLSTQEVLQAVQGIVQQDIAQTAIPSHLAIKEAVQEATKTMAGVTTIRSCLEEKTVGPTPTRDPQVENLVRETLNAGAQRINVWDDTRKLLYSSEGVIGSPSLTKEQQGDQLTQAIVAQRERPPTGLEMADSYYYLANPKIREFLSTSLPKDIGEKYRLDTLVLAQQTGNNPEARQYLNEMYRGKGNAVQASINFAQQIWRDSQGGASFPPIIGEAEAAPRAGNVFFQTTHHVCVAVGFNAFRLVDRAALERDGVTIDPKNKKLVPPPQKDEDKKKTLMFN